MSGEIVSQTAWSGLQYDTKIPIAQLGPNIFEPEHTYLEADVALIWPYSSSTQQLGLLLAEKDIRLRRSKGQVKIYFHGDCAREVAQLHIAIGDSVRLGLQDVQWTRSGEQVSTPGKKVDWDVDIRSKIHLELHKSDGVVMSVVFTTNKSPKSLDIHSNNEKKPTPNQSIAEPDLRSIDNTFSSPLVVKHRYSTDKLVNTSLDPFVEDDGYILGRGRKRARFSRYSGAWQLVDNKNEAHRTTPIRSTDQEQLEKEYVKAQPAQDSFSVNTTGPAETSRESLGPEDLIRDPLVLPLAETVRDIQSDVISPATTTEDLQTSSQTLHTMGPPSLPFPKTPERPTRPILHLDEPLIPVPTPYLQPLASPGLALVSPLVERAGLLTGYFPPPFGSIAENGNKSKVVLQTTASSYESAPDEVSINGLFSTGARDFTHSHNHIMATSQADTNTPIPFQDAIDTGTLAKNHTGLDRNPTRPAGINRSSPDSTSSDVDLDALQQQIDESNLTSQDESTDQQRESEDMYGPPMVEQSRSAFDSAADSHNTGGLGFSATSALASDVPLLDVMTIDSSSEEEEAYDTRENDNEKDHNNHGESVVEADLATLSGSEGSGMESDRHDAVDGKLESALTTGCVHIVTNARTAITTINNEHTAIEVTEIAAPIQKDIPSGQITANSTEELIAESRLVDSRSLAEGLAEGQKHTRQARSSIREEDDDIGNQNANSLQNVDTSPGQLVHGPLGLEVNTGISLEGNKVTNDLHIEHQEPNQAEKGQITALTTTDYDEIFPSVQSIHNFPYIITPDATQEISPMVYDITTPVFADFPSIFPPSPELTQQAVESFETTSPVTLETSEGNAHVESFVNNMSEQALQSHRRSSQRLSRRSFTNEQISTEYFTPRRSGRNVTSSPTFGPSSPSTVRVLHASGSDNEVVERSSEAVQDAVTTRAVDPSPARGEITSLSYYPSLSTINEHFGSHVDIIAVCASAFGQPLRAKAGPKDYYNTLHLVDASLGEADAPICAEIYRPQKAALPTGNSGDTILLRNMKVQTHKHKFMLISTEASAWSIFTRDTVGNLDANIPGPPVEYGESEFQIIERLQNWWLSDGQTRFSRNHSTMNADQIPRATRSSSPMVTRSQAKRSGADSVVHPSVQQTSALEQIVPVAREENFSETQGRSPSMELPQSPKTDNNKPKHRRTRSRRSESIVHELRDGTKYIDSDRKQRSGSVIHELRDGSTWVDP